MKNRIEYRYRLSLNRTVLRLTGTKILQKFDMMRCQGDFFLFPAKVSHSTLTHSACVPARLWDTPAK